MKSFLRFAFLGSLPLFFGAAGCSGTSVSVGELDASTATDAGTGNGNIDSGLGPDGSIIGPKVSIYVRATAETFPHSDNLSSLQPTDARLWIRSLAFDFSNGPSGVKIFELKEPKETSLNDKAETLVAEVPIAMLPVGTAIKAHVVTDAVAYRVPTKLHYNGMVLDGEIKGWQALSNGALDPDLKQARQSGFYKVDFLLGGNKVADTSGDNAPLPEGPAGGGFELSVNQGVGAYSFPLVLPVKNDVQGDRKMYMTINVDRNFRWTDSKKAGYVGGAWDTEPPMFEPVVRFGANSFTLTLE